jgi:type VI secretion system secreted protein VgrG
LNSRDPVVRPGIDVHQYYTLEVTGTPGAALADIYSFTGTSGMGVPPQYTIQFTHPQRDLPRGDYVNRMATFLIQPPPASRWSKPEAARRVYGVITSMAQVTSNHDQTLYEVTLESRLALLRNMPRTRFFLDMSERDVIGQILREHEFNQIFGGYEFDLYRTYRKRPIITQWCEDDLSFVMRLCRRVGIWFVCEPNGRYENVRFGDDFTKYIHDKARFTVPYREHSGLHTTGRESVQSLTMRTTMVPAKFSVRSYSPEQPHNLCMNGTGTIHSDPTVYGESYTWGLDLDDEQDAAREAGLRQEAVLAEQIVYTGTCDMLDIAPSCVLELSNRELSEVKYGLLITGVKCSASRKQGYKAEFTAIPSDRQYRMPLMESTWPRVPGVITGTITSTPDYVGPYLDDQGRYIVNLHVDRDPRTPGLESCPMRLAKPFAGPGNVGFHFGLEPETVVGVAFLWNNPDLPYISHVLHTAGHTDPIHMGHPWAQRNTIHTRSNNTIQLEDREGQEHIKVATENGKSQLNLGHMVDRGQEQRGSGAELRTDGAAAIRGGGGVIVSAYARNGATGKQLDMQETVAQLEDALALAKALASSAQASKAEAADTDNQQAVNKALDQLHGSSVLVTTPGTAGMVTGKDTQFVADGNIAGVAKGDVSWSAWNRFTVAVRDRVSLFAQKGMSLIAAAGNVVMQAQRGRMQLAAQEDMSVESVNGVVHVKAAKEIILNVDGTYIKLNGNGVEIGSRGGVLYRTAGVKGSGPAQMELSGAAFAPQFVPYTTQCEVWRTNPDFVPPPAPTPEMNGLGSTGAVPPAPLPDTGAVPPSFLGGIFGGKSNTESEAPNNGGLTVNDPENEQQICLPPDPIQMTSPAPCNWQLSDFTTSATMERETPTYQKYGWTRTERLTDGGQPVMCAGTAPTTCQFTYDAANKTLTAKVVTALVPRLLVKMNPATGEPVRDENNQYIVVQYETFGNGANSHKSFAEQGLMLVERDPKDVDASTYKNQIEKTLNQGNYKLILDGCSKGAACGCRISVKFCADVHVVRAADAPALNPNITINLYPTTARADANNWPEKDFELQPATGRYSEKFTQTKAHETGHLFNFPDEYWEQGGFVHSIYVQDGKNIDFKLADANKAKNTFWIIETATNLMGGGCLQPTATTSPYYLEYIRRWFSEHTNKLWRVGYDAPARKS